MKTFMRYKENVSFRFVVSLNMFEYLNYYLENRFVADFCS